jgi:hypothetical protein
MLPSGESKRSAGRQHLVDTPEHLTHIARYHERDRTSHFTRSARGNSSRGGLSTALGSGGAPIRAATTNGGVRIRSAN